MTLNLAKLKIIFSMRISPRMIVLAPLFVLAVAGIVFISYFAYQVRALARQSNPPQQTHGLVFPASAVFVDHDVEPDVVRLDGGATTRLDLPAADLTAFLAQLSVRNTAAAPYAYPAHAPKWSRTRYTCESPTGDFLYVDVGDSTQPVISIQLYTDWN